MPSSSSSPIFHSSSFLIHQGVSFNRSLEEVHLFVMGKLRNKTAYPGSLIDRYYTGDVRVSFDFRSLLFYSWTRRWLTISNFPCIADGQDTPSQFD